MARASITAILLALFAAGCVTTASGDASGPAGPVGPSVPSVVTIAPADTEPGDGIPMRSASDMTVVARNRLPDTRPSNPPVTALLPFP
jgi:hypothetical protein